MLIATVSVYYLVRSTRLMHIGVNQNSLLATAEARACYSSQANRRLVGLTGTKKTYLFFPSLLPFPSYYYLL